MTTLPTSSLPTKPERPPSLDEDGHRKFIIPAEVKGRFRNLRNYTQWILLCFFIVAPWLKISGQQIFLLDIINRKFYFLGLTLYSHDAPMVFLLILIVVFGLVFVTTLWGRVFCGWACPQTVFIDGLFRKIEILIEGKYLKRRRMMQSPLDAKIFLTKITKWFLFVVVSSIIAHSFIAFFVGSETLLHMMQKKPQENWSYFVLVSVITLIILFDFAWFREQFCLIVCPYGRFQSVLLGRKTLNITYDVQRGEPRKGVSLVHGIPRGDCVNCRRCVEVCPTGIDIRHGLQLECIGCTACIDACDEIMEKLKKPKGLIRYMNSLGENKSNLKSPRALFALAIVVLAFSTLATLIFFRKEIDVSVLRGKDSLFQKVEESGIEQYINHFKVHIKNQTNSSLNLKIESFFEETPLTIIAPQNPVKLKSQENFEMHIFIRFSSHILKNGNAPVVIKFINTSSNKVVTQKNVRLVGPGGW